VELKMSLERQKMSLDKVEVENTKSRLLDKLQQGTISRGEAEMLRGILEQEKEDAERRGNAALVVGIAILLGFVAKYIADEKIVDKIVKALSGKKR
jgi:predicted nucleic acid-binding protein